MGSVGREFAHTSVLLRECIDALDVHADGIYADCTTGGGGHSLEIAKRIDFDRGKLFCFDQDSEAIAAAGERLASFPVTFVHGNFSLFQSATDELLFDGVLMDLGVSSHQLDSAERGFSFHEEAPLDMRMSKNGLSAYDVVNTYDEERLAEILFQYGEEKYARGISRGIARAREAAPIETTLELAEIIRSNVPQKVRREKNPCRKTFQAIRIEVNNELGVLKDTLPQIFEQLAVGGRLAIISFHSLEDRIVKNLYKAWATGCTCPPDFPVCVCGKSPQGKLVYRKPIVPSEEELQQNPRSRSAKLRVIEKI